MGGRKLFNIDDCMAFVVTESSKKFADAFQKSLRDYNMSRSQWLALYYIHNNYNLSQVQLANLMGLKGPTIVKLLQNLEADGYIRRVNSEEDKREKDIILLEKGKKKVKETLPVVEGFKNKVVQGISEEELETIKKVLKIMVINTENI